MTSVSLALKGNLELLISNSGNFIYILATPFDKKNKIFVLFFPYFTNRLNMLLKQLPFLLLLLSLGHDLHLQLKAEKGRNLDEVRYTLDQVTSMNRVKRCVDTLEEKLDKLEGLWQGDRRREKRMKMEEQNGGANGSWRADLELAIKTVCSSSTHNNKLCFDCAFELVS